MKHNIYNDQLAKPGSNSRNFVPVFRAENFLSIIFKTIPAILLIAGMSVRSIAQCPGTTYSVGSGVGIPNLSGAPVGVANLTSGQSIQVSGTFTVDAGAWNISGATVYLTSNASGIIVNSGATINASSGSIFQGCNTTYKWTSIRVLGGGTLISNACTFNNGQNAIDIAGTAVFHITGNTFNNCSNGLRISGTQNVLNHTITSNFFVDSEDAGILLASASNITIGFNTYRETGATYNSAGVRANQAKYVLVNGGFMDRIKYGLDIQNGTSTFCIDFANVTFRGTTAVRSNQALYGLIIRDCNIVAGSTGIDITNHLTSQNLPPGFACSGNIDILRNVISTEVRTGIRVAFTNGNGKITVHDNDIQVPLCTSPNRWFYGIQIFESPFASVEVSLNVVDHLGNITPSTFPGGIYLYNCKVENLVSNNLVNGIFSPGTGHLNFGIAAVNSPHITVRDNTVDGRFGLINRAISIEHPEVDIDLCCNTMTQAEKGLYMLGAHKDCIIQTSIFGQINEALYYDMVVSSSAPQWHRGNDWSGATTTWDGYFNGSPLFAPTVKYRVAPSHLPNGLSKIFVTGGNPSDWFSTSSGTELSCGSPCGNGFSGEGGEELTGNDFWAMDTLTDPTYATLHWIAQQNLFAKITAHPALFSDPQAAAFYANASAGNIGKCYLIKTGIENLYDSTLTANPAQKLADLQVLNASIIPTTTYEANEKTIFNLRLTALAQDDWEFSESEKNIIDAIAALCPQSGGNAVYVARYLQEYYRVPTWNMDCAFVGARDESRTTLENKGIALFPNPAQTEVQISLQQPAMADCQITVFNLTGQIVATQSVSEGSMTARLSVAHFANGCYIVSLSENGRQVYQQKLSIIR
ncbi:MAG TPA: hypothetical protein DCF33_06960 [Saprospirales bacterium]|nr:hypothetical protein [Saprospirales bacterium]